MKDNNDDEPQRPFRLSEALGRFIKRYSERDYKVFNMLMEYHRKKRKGSFSKSEDKEQS